MAELKLNVHNIPQRRGNTCWYAAACMVCLYTGRQGPRQGLPEKWAANEPTGFAENQKLAQVEGLLRLDSATHEFSPASLIATLGKHGPIMAGGRWYGNGHMIVVTGANDAGSGNVYLNDPDKGVVKTGTVDWFNKSRFRGWMWVKDPARY